MDPCPVQYMLLGSSKLSHLDNLSREPWERFRNLHKYFKTLIFRSRVLSQMYNNAFDVKGLICSSVNHTEYLSKGKIFTLKYGLFKRISKLFTVECYQ